MANVLRIDLKDNVAVALHDLAEGEPLEMAAPGAGPGVIAQAAIPFGHKVALIPIAKGETVIKYGAPIGVTIEDIVPGQHVHVHNLRSVRGAARQ